MTKILTYKPPQQYDVIGEILKKINGRVDVLTNWSFRMPRQIEIHLPPYVDPFGPTPKPTLEPCNYKCRVCAGQNSGRRLKFGWEPKALKLLDSLKGEIKFFIFSGHYTEPMNNRYFFDFLEKTKINGAHFGVHTNGSRLLEFENQLSGITKTLMLPGITSDDFISVSVYGGCEKSFSTATGTKPSSDYFQKVIDGVSLLGRLKQKMGSKISLRISYLGSSVNLHPEEAKIVIDLAKKAKFNSLRFSIAFAPYDLDFSTVGAVGKWERKKEKEVLSWLGPLLSTSQKDHPYFFYRPVAIQDIKRFDQVKLCFGGYLQITISASGQYVKCATVTASSKHQLGPVSGSLGSFCTAVRKNQNANFDPCRACFNHGLRCDPLCTGFNVKLSRVL